jgi:hypothetical protein
MNLAVRRRVCHRVQSVDGGGDWGKMNWKDVKRCGMIQNRYHPGKCVERLRIIEKP